MYIFGLMAEGRSRLSVVVAWGIRRYHRCIRKDGSLLERSAITRYLKVAMVRSDALLRRRQGGTNW